MKNISFNLKRQPLWERIFLAILTMFFIVLLTYIVVSNRGFTPEQWKIVRLFASFSAAGMGAFLTGMLEIDGERPGLIIRATGSLAAFVLVFLLF